jgi:hypothetical protein
MEDLLDAKRATILEGKIVIKHAAAFTVISSPPSPIFVLEEIL